MSKIQADEEVKLNKNIPQKPEIGYHYPLYLISVITGLCVLVDAKRYKAKNSFLHKLYSICLVTIIIYGALYSGRGRVLYIYKYLLQTVRINDIIQQILLTISTVYAILNILFRGVKIINVYFEKLQKIDKQLLTTMNLKKKKILSHVRLVTYHIIIISVSIGDFFAWSYSMGYEAWIYYGFRLYMFYLNLLIVLQLTTFTCALHTRFAIVNERLLDSFMHWSNELDCRKKREIMNELCPEVLTISFVKYLPVACITSIHDMLCDLLDVVNDIFGFDIFFLVANIIINCVLSLNAILIFGTGLQVATNQDGDWAILVLNAAWALFCIVSITL